LSTSPKNKNDDDLYLAAASGFFRVRGGRVEVCYRWNGHTYKRCRWIVCDCNDGAGYLYVSYKGVKIKSHRLAYLLYHPDAQIRNREINHKDGDPLNNFEKNLEPCDASYQSKHAYDIGLNRGRGERHHLAKLSDETVVKVRSLRAIGVTFERLSRDFGVTPRAIRLACLRQTWAHVK
jgi:hypothetical protein